MNDDTPTVGRLLNGADSGWSHRDLHQWLEQRTGLGLAENFGDRHHLFSKAHEMHHHAVRFWIIDRLFDVSNAPCPIELPDLWNHAETHRWEIDAITRINQKQGPPVNPRIPRRIQAAWNILRGQPTAYRTKITGTIHVGPTTVICECVFLPNARHEGDNK